MARRPPQRPLCRSLAGRSPDARHFVLRIVSIPVIPLRDGRSLVYYMARGSDDVFASAGRRLAAGAAGRGSSADAEAYDRTRPVCPDVVFDDLVRLARLGQGDRAAEIGCGTGQATVPLAQRGLAVTAVELGAALADLARDRNRQAAVPAGSPALPVLQAPRRSLFST
jgi:SAM-dependent methyltransferase